MGRRRESKRGSLALERREEKERERKERKGERGKLNLDVNRCPDQKFCNKNWFILYSQKFKYQLNFFSVFLFSKMI